jgi:hypothetical protein
MEKPDVSVELYIEAMIVFEVTKEIRPFRNVATCYIYP